jgi:hypothetical protein
VSPLVVPTLRVFSGRAPAVGWVVSVLAASVWVLLAWIAHAEAHATAFDLMRLWRFVVVVCLLFLGAGLASATLSMACPQDQLQPGRRRATANVGVALGTACVMVFFLAGAALQAQAFDSLWMNLAEASMAFASGASFVFALTQRHVAPFFVALGLGLPLVGYALEPSTKLISQQGPAGLYVVWLLAWPACAARIWWLVARRPVPLTTFASVEAALNDASALRARSMAADLTAMRGHVDWLLRTPEMQGRNGSMVVLWIAAIAFMVWLDSRQAQPNLTVFFGAMAGWWAVAVHRLREGVRPTLLLLPGRRVRQQLGWLLFAEGLRRGAIVLWWLLPAAAITLWLRPSLHPMQVAVALALLWAGGTVCMAWLVCTWAWIKRPRRRAVAQIVVAGGTGLATLIGTSAWYHGATAGTALVFAQGLVVALGLLLLSLLLVAASSRAWQRADLHALFGPKHQRGAQSG